MGVPDEEGQVVEGRMDMAGWGWLLADGRMGRAGCKGLDREGRVGRAGNRVGMSGKYS